MELNEQSLGPNLGLANSKVISWLREELQKIY